jgi:hypothetical protein
MSVSDKNNGIEVDKDAAIKERRHKARVTVVFWTGFFLFGMGLTMFGQSYIEQGYSLTPPKFNQLHEANGVLKTARSGRFNLFVVIDNKTNNRYSCNTGICGFEGDSDVIGKPVKVFTYNDAIYQIEVDNVVRHDYAESIGYRTRNKILGIKLLIPGIFVMALVQVYKRRQRREANG